MIYFKGCLRKKNVKRQAQKQGDQLGILIGVQWEKKEAGVRVIMMEVGSSSQVEGIFWNYSLNLICGCVVHIWWLCYVPLAHLWFHLWLWWAVPKSPPSPVLLLQHQRSHPPWPIDRQRGVQAGDIITRRQPSTNRALELHECFCLLSSMWKILEGVPCTSQRSNLHQQPWTQPHYANLSSFSWSPHHLIPAS